MASKTHTLGRKLTIAQIEEVYKMVAMGYNANMIVSEMKNLFDVDITRQTIHKSYVTNRVVLKKCEKLREVWAKEVMKHPLANKNVRLGYILKGITDCLRGSEKLILLSEATQGKDGEKGRDAQFIKEVKKVLGPLAPLIREARAEAEGEDQKGMADAEKMSMLDIIKQFAEAVTKPNDKRGKTSSKKVGKGQQGTSDTLDKPGTGVIEIL